MSFAILSGWGLCLPASLPSTFRLWGGWSGKGEGDGGREALTDRKGDRELFSCREKMKEGQGAAAALAQGYRAEGRQQMPQ